MATTRAVSLELPNGEVYASEGVNVEYQGQVTYLVNNQAIASIFERFIDGGNAPDGSSLRQQIRLTTGAGRRSIRVEFTEFEGATHDWGPASASDDALTKLQILENRLSSSVIDSSSPAFFRQGEYDEDGMFAPIPVVVEEHSLRMGIADGQVSAFTPSLTLVEATDAQQSIDALERIG